MTRRARRSCALRGRGSARPIIIRRACAGVGADCLGLVRGVWRELYGCDAEAPPAYSRDWAEAAAARRMLAAARAAPACDRAGRRPAPATCWSSACAPARSPSTRRSSASATTMIHAMEGAPPARSRCRRGGGGASPAAFAFPGTVARGSRCVDATLMATLALPLPAPRSAARCCRPASPCSARRISGAAIGSQIGALAGSVIDQALLGGGRQTGASKARGSPSCTSRPRPKARRSRASTAARGSAGRSSGRRRSRRR